jgi:hypothetical protein
MNPPDYLKDRVRASQDDGPSQTMIDGQWCGHGEPQYEVFDISNENAVLFKVRLPIPDSEAVNPPVVEVKSESGSAFAVYDARNHPCGVYYGDGRLGVMEPRMQDDFRCPDCGEGIFKVAVGFEIPSDSAGPNDTSWFTLALRCVNCQWEGIVYEDETA